MKKIFLVFSFIFIFGCATLPPEGIPCPDNTKEVDMVKEEIKQKVDIWGKIIAFLLLPKYFLYTVIDTVTGIEYYILGTKLPKLNKSEKIIEEEKVEIPLKSIMVCSEIQNDPVFKIN